MTQLLRLLSLILIGTIACSSLLAQMPKDELGPVPARPLDPAPQVGVKKVASSVGLPFSDDFSYPGSRPDPRLWADDNVYINQSFGESPPTIGVATFDGLNRHGLAYNINNLGRDTADILTSQPIDLSNANDSVYLSFFWQAGGFGESSESGDSLAVHFFDRDSLEWRSVWSVGGGASTSFRQVMIPVAGSAFLQDSFRFRFMAHGNQAGGFDVWNIDYVRLDDDRTFADTLFTDIAFTQPHPSLLHDYEAIPWFHASPTILNALFKDNLRVYYQRNLRTGDTYNPFLGIYEVTMEGQLIDEDPNGSLNLDTEKPDNTESTYLYEPDLSVTSVPDEEFTIDLYTTYQLAGPLSSRSHNDTLKHQQVYSNYYAYDDGSAERAYSVSDNSGGFILSRYEILADNDVEHDVIKGLYIYFFPAEFDIEDNEFTIVVYSEDNDGLPDQLLYESDSIYTAEYSSSNFYLPYKLDGDGVQVSGNVFVGIRQQSSRRMTIGFDRNNTDRTETFYGSNTGSGLFQSFHDGTLMMRPYLSYDPHDISVPESPTKEKVGVAVYPNPASDRIHLNLDEREHRDYRYSLIDLSGRTLQSGKLAAEIGFHQKVRTGMYLLKIEDPAGNKDPMVTKLIINR